MEEQQAADSGGTPAPVACADAPLNEKRIATIKAELAIRGFEVHDTNAGGWLVVRWNLSKNCPRIEDLESFLCRVGGAT